VIQDIINGIVAALAGSFPGIKIYDEQVKQGLKEPCFIVRCVNPMNIPLLGDRALRTHLFSINYQPQSKTDAKAECYNVLDTLYQTLNYITVAGDLVRGINMRGQFVDGMIDFTLSYNVIIREVAEPEEPMETLELSSAVIGG